MCVRERGLFVYIFHQLSGVGEAMNPEVINSTSSVSTTRKKREAERSVNWTVEETQVLLCAWSDERIQKCLAENLRNRHVFKHLSMRMSEMGFCRSPHQCRLRVKTLKANYVRAKLQRNVDSSAPCTFRYFAEMDTVLGRRSVESAEMPFLSALEHKSAQSPQDVANGVWDFNSNRDIGSHRFGSAARMERARSELEGSRRWSQLDSKVKIEDREDSTDEFELINDVGFSQGDERHEVYAESADHQQIHVSPVDNTLRTVSPYTVPPSSLPPPLSQSAAASLPARPPVSSSPVPHLDSSSPGLLSALQPLLDSFQRLSSETRVLLEQLDRQRQDQHRWQQELLSEWLQREERQQREAADREERREKSRMEHEIRVLELLTGLIREHGCRCGGGSDKLSDTAGGVGHTTDTDESH